MIITLAAAAAVGGAVRLRAGKIRSFRRTDRGDSPGPERLEADDLGAPLGDRATLVQFSTEFCASCGPTAALLGEIAAEQDGIAVVEVDAAERMDLTRRLRVFGTPTVLVLGPDGAVTARMAGYPRGIGRGRLAGEKLKADLTQSLRSVMDDGVRS